MQKKYTIKVYDKNGTTYKGSYEPLSGYSFDKVINGGCGAMVISLPRKFDDYGLGEDVDLLDKIELWVQDIDSNGALVYSGFISRIKTVINGSGENVELTVLGYVARLGFSLDKGAGPTPSISVVRNSQTAGESVQDIIDSYQTFNDSIITYTADSIDITGTDVSYTSDSKSYLESIERFRQMAGENWYWYLDANNILHFKQLPTTATHTFIFGKDIGYLSTDRNADDIKNTFILWNSLQEDDVNFISKMYYSGNSVTDYWERFERQTDGRIKDVTTADKLGTAFVNSYKNPNISLTFEVKDNNLGLGYDIESIEPGDTCRILNISSQSVINDNMVITGISYTPESVVVLVSDLRSLTGRSLTDIRRSLDTTVYGDGVSSITLDDID